MNASASENPGAQSPNIPRTPPKFPNLETSTLPSQYHLPPANHPMVVSPLPPPMPSYPMPYGTYPYPMFPYYPAMYYPGHQYAGRADVSSPLVQVPLSLFQHLAPLAAPTLLSPVHHQGPHVPAHSPHMVTSPSAADASSRSAETLPKAPTHEGEASARTTSTHGSVPAPTNPPPGPREQSSVMVSVPPARTSMSMHYPHPFHPQLYPMPPPLPSHALPSLPVQLAVHTTSQDAQIPTPQPLSRANSQGPAPAAGAAVDVPAEATALPYLAHAQLQAPMQAQLQAHMQAMAHAHALSQAQAYGHAAVRGYGLPPPQPLVQSTNFPAQTHTAAAPATPAAAAITAQPLLTPAPMTSASVSQEAPPLEPASSTEAAKSTNSGAVSPPYPSGFQTPPRAFPSQQSSQSQPPLHAATSPALTSSGPAAHPHTASAFSLAAPSGIPPPPPYHPSAAGPSARLTPSRPHAHHSGNGNVAGVVSLPSPPAAANTGSGAGTPGDGAAFASFRSDSPPRNKEHSRNSSLPNSRTSSPSRVSHSHPHGHVPPPPPPPPRFLFQPPSQTPSTRVSPRAASTHSTVNSLSEWNASNGHGATQVPGATITFPSAFPYPVPTESSSAASTTTPVALTSSSKRRLRKKRTKLHYLALESSKRLRTDEAGSHVSASGARDAAAEEEQDSSLRESDSSDNEAPSTEPATDSAATAPGTSAGLTGDANASVWFPVGGVVAGHAIMLLGGRRAVVAVERGIVSQYIDAVPLYNFTNGCTQTAPHTTPTVEIPSAPAPPIPVVPLNLSDAQETSPAYNAVDEDILQNESFKEEQDVIPPPPSSWIPIGQHQPPPAPSPRFTNSYYFSTDRFKRTSEVGGHSFEEEEED